MLFVVLLYDLQEPARGEVDIIECRDVFKDASEAGSQPPLRPPQRGQRPEGQHGYVMEDEEDLPSGSCIDGFLPPQALTVLGAPSSFHWLWPRKQK